MKKSILLSAIIFVLTFTINAQNDTMYVMKSGVVVGKYNVNTQVDSVIFYRPQTQSSFLGITELNETADIIGNIDTTDWKFTDTWSLNEENLFKKNNSANIVTETTRPSSSVVVIGYPNPAKDIMSIAFQLEPDMYYDLRIVDNNMNVKVKLDSAKNSLSIRDSAFINKELYRIYYKIYSENKVYRGHGDFKFIK